MIVQIMDTDDLMSTEVMYDINIKRLIALLYFNF